MAIGFKPRKPTRSERADFAAIGLHLLTVYERQIPPRRLEL
jgi:hypothetical protein